MARATQGAPASSASPVDSAAAAPIETLPSALIAFRGVQAELGDRIPILCLDFDGTLSPIVEDPKAARLLDGVEAVLASLAAKVPLFVLSGRDAPDVCERVHLPHILYAGSHGFEVVQMDGQREPLEEALPYLPHLAAVEKRLTTETAKIPGVKLDRKQFGLAVHDRLVADGDLEELWRIVAEVGADFPMLRAMRGKRVTEFLPNIDWNKGKALLWLLEMVGYDEERHLPICIGDDITDEDALRTVRGRGVGIVVGSGQRYSAATYALRDPVEVWEFLVRLSRLLDERSRGARADGTS
jgi:alpha,alpha-trehalase